VRSSHSPLLSKTDETIPGDSPGHGLHTPYDTAPQKLSARSERRKHSPRYEERLSDLSRQSCFQNAARSRAGSPRPGRVIIETVMASVALAEHHPGSTVDPRIAEVSDHQRPRRAALVVAFLVVTAGLSLAAGWTWWPRTSRTDVYSAFAGVYVMSPLQASAPTCPISSGCRFPDSPAFWAGLGHIGRDSAALFLARLARSEPVRDLAFKAGALKGAYLAEPVNSASSGRFGAALVRIVGYAHQPREAVLIATRIAAALRRYVSAHTSTALVAEDRFKALQLPTYARKQPTTTPKTARSF
jgi:hypothetical protein